MELSAILQALHQRPIAYYPAYTKVTGSVTGGVLLSQLLYWWGHYGRKFHKGDEDLRQEVSLSVREFREAKSKLKELPFLLVTREGVPATTWYDINPASLAESLAKTVQTSSYKTEEKSVKQLTGKQIDAEVHIHHSSVPTRLNDMSYQLVRTTVVPTITEIVSETDKEETPILSAPKSERYSVGFEKFWLAYPVKKEKAKAWKSWSRQKLEARTAQILASIPEHVEKDSNWQRGYIKHPATYLNDACWNDEFDVRQELPSRPAKPCDHRGATPIAVGVRHCGKCDRRITETEFEQARGLIRSHA